MSMNKLKQLANNSMEVVKLASALIPEIKKQLKGKKEEELREYMQTEESMKEFAENLYQNMPQHIKLKCDIDKFTAFVLMNRKKLLKSKKNHKKVYGDAKA